MMWILSFVAFLITVVGADDISYVCDFEDDTCGFTNEEKLAARWEREEVELGGKKGYVMSLKYNGTSQQTLGRMITPYFDIDDEVLPGCFNFDFFVSGDGLTSFSVQQEREFGIISVWVYGARVPPPQGWQKMRGIRVAIDPATRFFFTAVIDPSLGETTLAVDNMELNLKACDDLV